MIESVNPKIILFFFFKSRNCHITYTGHVGIRKGTRLGSGCLASEADS